MNDQSMTISIIVIPSVIHQGNDTRAPNVTFIPVCAQRQAPSEAPLLVLPGPLPRGLITNQLFFAAACEPKSNVLFDQK